MSMQPVSHTLKMNTCLFADSERARQQPLDARDRSGQLVKQRYRLERHISGGALDAVYAAFDLGRQQQCWLRIVRTSASRALKPNLRFFHETALIQRLSHPNIVEVRDFTQDTDGTCFVVMERLEGEDLSSQLLRWGKLPLSRVLEVVRAVGSALQYAHDQGVVHRDVKPGNIFLCRQPSSDAQPQGDQTIKILGFGLGTTNGGDTDANSRTQRMIIGSPAYVAPEALLSSSDLVDGRADQWALAVLTYRMLSGQLPFNHPDSCSFGAMIQESEPRPLAARMPELPHHVLTAIATAMAKDREQRYAKIQDFVRALEGQPPEAPRASEQQDAIVVRRQVQAEPSTSFFSEQWVDMPPLSELQSVGSRRARPLPWIAGFLLLALSLLLLCKLLDPQSLSRLGEPQPQVAAASVELPAEGSCPMDAPPSPAPMPSPAPVVPPELPTAAAKALPGSSLKSKVSGLRKRPGSPPPRTEDPMPLLQNGPSDEQDTDDQADLPDTQDGGISRIEIMP